MGALTLSRTVTVLGSTGSVGANTLDLLGHAVASGSAEIEVIALAAGRNVELLAEQALRWRPKLTVIQDESRLADLRSRLDGSGLATAAGDAAVCEAAAMGAE